MPHHFRYSFLITLYIRYSGRKMFRRSLFIFLVLYVHNSSCVIDDLYNAGEKMWKLYLMLDEVKQHDDPITEIVLRGENLKNPEIKNQIDTISKKLNEIEKFMNPKKMTNLLNFVRSDVILYSCLTGLEIFVGNIDDNYERFHGYMNGEYNKNDDSLGELIQNMVVTVEGEITWIRRLILEDSSVLLNRSNVVKAIADRAIRLHAQLCDVPQLTSSILVQLLQIAMIAEIKANLVLSLGNLCQYFHYPGWKTMNSFSRKSFEEHFSRYVNAFQINLSVTDSLYLRACDRANGNLTRNKHFYELEETIQTTIFHYDWASCKFSSCNDIWSDEWDQCMSKVYDTRTGCSQTTASCAYLGTIKASALTSGPYKFQYLNSTELGALGTNFICPEDNGYTIGNVPGWSTHRSNCACDCYGEDNQISLSVMTSRPNSNLVIIGLRFIRKNGILYIQPRVGKLAANGYISPSTERWIRIPKNASIHKIGRKNRVFFFDDLRLPASHVLTGVKFNRVTRADVTGFAIEIFGRPFDYRSGIVNPKNTSHVSVKAANIRSGTPLPFKRVSPIHVLAPQIPDSEGIGYVTLERSELSADFGQSTLPFFDAVPIVTTPPSILRGIGLFHKGTADHAGIISLRVFGIQYNKHLSEFQLHHMPNGRVSFNNSNNHTN